jgi:hypothetical protein
MFVSIGIVIVVIGGVMMIYLIPTSPQQFTLENGFITSDEAKNIVHKSDVASTEFVFFKYTIMNNGGCNVVMYPANPYSQKTIGNGSEISLPCFPYGFPDKIKGFAWSVVSAPEAKNCSPTMNFVDAKNGEYMGAWGVCFMTIFHHNQPD